jgi:hypothetical protein
MEWLVAFVIVSTVFGFLGCILGVIALIYCVGVAHSTHKVQWVPIDDPTAQTGEDIAEELSGERLIKKQDKETAPKIMEHY